ncbi:MAG TPA: GNAT family N-acetyltransferase [Lachnospiraceae bacterium]|nr:GNAT family N-acetyltransferase [Lachnospiraceae bacterium]
MITIRNYKEDDLDPIQQMDFMLWLSIQWNQSFHKEDIFTAEDDEAGVVGVTALSWDGTWYYLEKENPNVSCYRMQMEVAVLPGYDKENEVRDELILKQMQHFIKYEKQYPGKNLRLRCWTMAEQKEEMQRLLKHGFIAFGITPILAFDLTGELPAPKETGSVQIGIHNCDEEGIQAYLTANEAGYDGIQDSEDEFRFRLNGEDVKVFTAKDQDRVVSSCTIWKIEEGHFATENVFTIPDYRRRGIGQEMLFTVLRYLKDAGAKKATLTVLGSNKTALALYQKMGYRLENVMHEMHYYV